MKIGRYTAIEYAIAFAFFLLLASFPLRYFYGAEIREWEQSLGLASYFVIVPLFLNVIWGRWSDSSRAAKGRGQPVVRPWVWAVAVEGIGVAGLGIVLS